MQALTFFFAFVAVLVLIGAVAWLVRRFAGNRLGGHGNRGRMPRLAVIDAAAVDGRRRLVLVRRDNVEHLLMIGGPSDIVVEPNIVRAMPARDQMPPRPSLGGEAGTWSEDARLEPEPALPPPPARPSRPSFADELRRAPAPPVQPEHRHDPLATIAPEPVTRPEPRPDLRAEPPVRPSQRNEPQMPRPPTRGNKEAAPKAPPKAAPPPPSPRAPELSSPAAPAPGASSADQNLAEMAKRLEAALRRPSGSGSEARPAAPAPEAPPVQPRPEPRINVGGTPGESSAPPVAPPKPKGDFENLEDEMASLLGRPKTPS
ncbi:MAG: flagellar biosynthetic protein FliO [Xanthobacteraceae bacterium]|nr:flagellar biosynthetic protein FliO [Xanthobacteraceae bacterium]